MTALAVIDVETLEAMMRRIVREETQAKPAEVWLTIPEAAKHFDRDASTIYLWIKKGRLQERNDFGKREVRVG